MSWVGVRLVRTVQPIQICLVNDVIVEESNLPDAEAGKQHSNGATGAAASDNSDTQLTQVVIERGAESERLAVQGVSIRRAVPTGIVERQLWPYDLNT